MTSSAAGEPATARRDEEPLVLPFSAIAEDDLARVGGKALSLAMLRAWGFAVPDGFALTTEASRRFAAQCELEPWLRRVEERIAQGGLPLAESWQEFGELRKRIVSAPVPAEIREALFSAYRSLGDRELPVAVRSSGTSEDLEDASFAGQYETYLGVRGEGPLLDAVRRCWASVWRNRVIQYGLRRTGGSAERAMSVIVQRLVEADVSGVLFTVNPLTGRENEVLVEAVFGLGEALVSGRVNADRFVVDSRTGEVLSSAVSTKAMKIVSEPPAPGGGERSAERYTSEVPLAEAAGRQPTLGPDRLAELADLAAAIQERYGRPMDVEWVLAGGKFYVVQARPVTRISFAADFGEWTTADFKDGGVSSDVCSPYMWSLYETVFDHALPRYLEEIKLLRPGSRAKWSRLFFARPYWNLGAVKEIMQTVPGFVERSFDTDLGIQVTYEGPGRTTPVTVRGVLRALPVLLALRRAYRRRLALNEAFLRRFAEAKKPFDLEEAEVSSLDRDCFVRRYRELLTGLYFETESNYFATIYNTSNSKLDFKVHFDRANRAAKGTLSYLKLVGGLEDLSHMRPIQEMYEICARLRRQGRPVDDETVRAFALRFKHHGRKELDIRVPRWKDDLDFVRDMLERALASFDPAHEPAAQAKRQHAQYLEERERACRALRWRPLARRAFRRGLDLVRAYAWWREEMRDRSAYAYYLVRLWACEAGRRLAAEGSLERPDDIFYLRHEESLDALEGRLPAAEARKRARAGRRMVLSFRNFKNPDEIGTRYRFEGASRGAAAPGGAPPDAERSILLRGIGCAPGCVTARAKVVRRLEEANKVEPGDILVTVFTDPGWTPLLAMVAGVVTETGGLLSHAAVISREYGIPAVLAVRDATRLIADGDRITVDGGAGTVSIPGPAAGRSGS